MKNRILIKSLALVLSAWIGLTSAAMADSSNAQSDNFTIEKEKHKLLESKSIQNDERLNLPSKSMRISATVVVGDAYEDNNSVATAFSYENTTKMSGDNFVDGYISASIHDANDIDIYSIYLKQGEEYFFNLKNLTTDYDLAVITPDQSSGYADFKTGTTAENFYIQPDTTGRYYVVVYGNGVPSFMNYFLYAGPSVITKTLSEPLGFETTFRSAGTSGTYTYDTRNKIRANSWLSSVSIDSNGVGYWVGLTKYLEAEDGSIYINQPPLDNLMYGEYTQRADQVWKIYGTCSQGTSHFIWRPNIKMTYSYLMTP